jgi:AraC family transcriptional regulator
MVLRPGAVEFGSRRSAMRRVTFSEGAVQLLPRHTEKWVGTYELQCLSLGISDAALMSACNGSSGEIALHPGSRPVVDDRVRALIAAVNAERVAGFPSGRLFLDSVEQALACALITGHAARRCCVPTYRGGLAPMRLRRVADLVHSKIDGEVTLAELAESAGLSVTHFSHMFRRSTGESPHQFVLRHRVERAKVLLRVAELRMLDVAVACGFKTQQHFSRVFRQFCGISPTRYRLEQSPPSARTEGVHSDCEPTRSRICASARGWARKAE